VLGNLPDYKAKPSMTGVVAYTVPKQRKRYPGSVTVREAWDGAFEEWPAKELLDKMVADGATVFKVSFNGERSVATKDPALATRLAALIQDGRSEVSQTVIG
jgi:hypothetical protein